MAEGSARILLVDDEHAVQKLLAYPLRKEGVQTREMLLERVWGDSEYRDPRTIDMNIRHLREKIERDPKHPELDVSDGTGPALARGDPDRVAQIIRILLDNALTHTREGTAISVTTMLGDGTAGLVTARAGNLLLGRARTEVVA
jgi:signal transduction histidine kinase